MVPHRFFNSSEELICLRVGVLVAQPSSMPHLTVFHKMYTTDYNYMSFPLLENPDVAQSAFGAHRVIPDRWKGMSPQQVREIRATQEMQKREKEVSDPGVCVVVGGCNTSHSHMCGISVGE